jgi:ubiquinone/menaquinone biosynthesis C-methylase UbiE
MILDIGCGNGKMSRFIQTFDSGEPGGGWVQSIPMDLSHKVLSKCRSVYAESTNLLPVVGNAFYLPFKARSFTGAVFAQVLEFLPSKARLLALTEAVRVLKPGGLLFIISMQGRQHVEYSLDLRHQQEVAMMCEPVKQAELFMQLNYLNCQLVKMEGLNAYRTNDFFMATLRRMDDEQKRQADKETTSEEASPQQRRAALWQ